MASFLLGVTDSAPQTCTTSFPVMRGIAPTEHLSRTISKSAKKLALNLGVRWDLFMPESQRYNQKTARIIYSQPESRSQQHSGNLEPRPSGERDGASTLITKTSPRASGLAYTLDSKTR